MFVKIALNKYCLEISQENTKKPNNPQIKTHESISYPWKHRWFTVFIVCVTVKQKILDKMVLTKGLSFILPQILPQKWSRILFKPRSSFFPVVGHHQVGSQR